MPALTANIFAVATDRTNQNWEGQAGQVNVPALTANVFAVATNRTNINNKTGNTCH